jgi:8-oxo-dGTP pyrophosphatase MutT (NUDIX family)
MLPANLPAEYDSSKTRPAAILILLYPDPQGGADTLVFTRRRDDMRHHPGQISFPGGRVEPDDPSPVAAALREAHEELGIAPADVALVGLLEPVHTVVSNYLITPVIGRAARRPAFTPNPAEVAEVIELPLAGLRDPAIHRTELRDTPWGRHDIHYYQYGPYNIWGATARILQLFLANLRE